MSKFVVGTLQPMCFKISTLKYAAVLILGVLFMVVFYEKHEKTNYRQTNRIVYDESYVVGSQEWMRKKEAEFEARKAHVREVCAKLNSKDQLVSTEKRYFWFDIEHGIALCAHAKVWLYIEFFSFPLLTYIWTNHGTFAFQMFHGLSRCSNYVTLLEGGSRQSHKSAIYMS